MCLVVIAWQVHPRYPLIIAGNRDELHARPSAAAGWWPDAPHVIGGRDLVAGGSWLGITRAGRVAVVTNNPLRPPGAERPRSRGQLVRDWLTGDAERTRFLDEVATDEGRYAGFSLMVGSVRQGLEGFIAPAGPLGSRWLLPLGITVLSNSAREDPSPKAAWLERAMSDYLFGGAIEPDSLLALLGRRMPVAEAVDESAWARTRVTPFVNGEHYGTRASTVILADASGEWQFIERRFNSGGIPVGESKAHSTTGPP